jgi:hypothetical protein
VENRAYYENPTIKGTAMFKRYSLEAKLVKTPKSNTPTSINVAPRARVTPEQITKIVKENVKQVAVAVVVGLVALKVTDAVCEIAVNAAPKN